MEAAKAKRPEEDAEKAKATKAKRPGAGTRINGSSKGLTQARIRRERRGCVSPGYYAGMQLYFMQLYFVRLYSMHLYIH